LDLVRRGGVHQFYATAFLVFGLWSLLPAVELYLPASYRGVSDLALWVAVAQLIHVATGVSGLVLLASPLYRWDFWANALLIGLLFSLGWWALPRYGTVSMGWALVASAVAYNLFKAVLVQKLLHAWPSGVKPLWALVYFVLAAGVHLLATWLPVGTVVAALVEASLQGVLFLAWILQSPELPDFKQMLNGWTRRLLPKQPNS
jgi:hypothetical protein